MAQSEDTELRDLVIEALERNGSLAKIRALLRANVFLAFEDDYENIKQNVSLDNILKLPEGKLSLSIVHEFLEFCNLKNTLFVYMAESRQKKDYSYDGSKKLSEKLNLPKMETAKEPILITLLKILSQRKNYDNTDNHNLKLDDTNFKDDQNCTYIVHEDSSSSASSNSQSDNSYDDKNKLHLRLQLDNSDTDTSSDSARDKSSSEYITNQNIVLNSKRQNLEKSKETPDLNQTLDQDEHNNSVRNGTHRLQEIKLTNSSSDSTSYADVKLYRPVLENIQNTIRLSKTDEEPTYNIVKQPTSNIPTGPHNHNPSDNYQSVTLSSGSTMSPKRENDTEVVAVKSLIEESAKSDAETTVYSYDFTASTLTKNKQIDGLQSPESTHEEYDNKSPDKNVSIESPHQNSQSSQSSVSISDVADLISENNSSFNHPMNFVNNISVNKTAVDEQSKKLSPIDKSRITDDSAEFSESPVPSLSNLSLDIHSD
ncbi:asparagine-rich protein-like [Hyposmocoma kahamanoa]|uniref:asparagine-rich protein-like n=1 Tax=Hyposmocoma kahamanoa TaxID=1477025 RepID=UPI000E6D6DD4|nr:asparagine-rich protein-like [Hyposmocoma kahamanoa]